MEFVNSITIGEAVVGLGTILLAATTAFLVYIPIREARRVRNSEVGRLFKARLLNEFENWIQEVIKALNKAPYGVKKWFGFKAKDYFHEKSELLEILLHLSDTAFFFRQKGKPFKTYRFEEQFETLFNKYHDCTDKLHDVVDPKSSEKEQNEEADCELELLNMANDFYKFINEIREKEKL